MVCRERKYQGNRMSPPAIFANRNLKIIASIFGNFAEVKILRKDIYQFFACYQLLIAGFHIFQCKLFRFHF